MASQVGVAPQFEGSVKGAGGDHPPVPRNVTTRHLVVVPAVKKDFEFK